MDNSVNIPTLFSIIQTIFYCKSGSKITLLLFIKKTIQRDKRCIRKARLSWLLLSVDDFNCVLCLKKRNRNRGDILSLSVFLVFKSEFVSVEEYCSLLTFLSMKKMNLLSLESKIHAGFTIGEVRGRMECDLIKMRIKTKCVSHQGFEEC